jgi:hypothetical protein
VAFQGQLVHLFWAYLPLFGYEVPSPELVDDLFAKTSYPKVGIERIAHTKVWTNISLAVQSDETHYLDTSGYD